MRLTRLRLLWLLIAGGLIAPLLLGQRSRYSQVPFEDVPVPPDAGEETEYYFPRLACQMGGGVRRLTNVHARSMEVYVQPLDEKLFDYPWQWASFLDSMRRVFPDRPIVDIEGSDEVFHVLYDIDERIQVPGIQYLRSGSTYERDGIEPRWRGIYDDKGRLMVAINFNMDLGDAWEWADLPEYPEPWTALAYRFGVNYIIYAMTH